MCGIISDHALADPGHCALDCVRGVRGIGVLIQRNADRLISRDSEVLLHLLVRHDKVHLALAVIADIGLHFSQRTARQRRDLHAGSPVILLRSEEPQHVRFRPGVPGCTDLQGIPGLQSDPVIVSLSVHQSLHDHRIFLAHPVRIDLSLKKIILERFQHLVVIAVNVDLQAVVILSRLHDLPVVLLHDLRIRLKSLFFRHLGIKGLPLKGPVVQRDLPQHVPDRQDTLEVFDLSHLLHSLLRDDVGKAVRLLVHLDIRSQPVVRRKSKLVIDPRIFRYIGCPEKKDASRGQRKQDSQESSFSGKHKPFRQNARQIRPLQAADIPVFPSLCRISADHLAKRERPHLPYKDQADHRKKEDEENGSSRDDAPVNLKRSGVRQIRYRQLRRRLFRADAAVHRHIPRNEDPSRFPVDQCGGTAAQHASCCIAAEEDHQQLRQEHGKRSSVRHAQRLHDTVLGETLQHGHLENAVNDKHREDTQRDQHRRLRHGLILIQASPHIRQPHRRIGQRLHDFRKRHLLPVPSHIWGQPVIACNCAPVKAIPFRKCSDLLLHRTRLVELQIDKASVHPVIQIFAYKGLHGASQLLPKLLGHLCQDS